MAFANSICKVLIHSHAGQSKPMNRKIRSTLKIISNTLVIAVVLFAFLLHGFQFFGLTPYSVLSGSMESIYPTGSLIYVKAVEPEKLKVDDIITFKTQGGIVATHRIIELVPTVADTKTTMIFENCVFENTSVVTNGLSGIITEIDIIF